MESHVINATSRSALELYFLGVSGTQYSCAFRQLLRRLSSGNADANVLVRMAFSGSQPGCEG